MSKIISEAAEIRSAIDNDYDAECVATTAPTIRDLQNRMTELRAKIEEIEAALKKINTQETT